MDQADEVRKKIDLAILTIEDALIERPASGVREKPRTERYRAEPNTSAEDNEWCVAVHVPPPATTSSYTAAVLNPPTRVMLSSTLPVRVTMSPLLAPVVVGTSSTSDVSADGSTTRPLPNVLPLLGALPGSSTAAESSHPILPVSDVP